MAAATAAAIAVVAEMAVAAGNIPEIFGVVAQEQEQGAEMLGAWA